MPVVDAPLAALEEKLWWQFALDDDITVYQQDVQDIMWLLDEQILGACDFVRRNMRISAVKLADGVREDRPQFDMLTVFEAVVNAVAHRDYSMLGSKVSIRLFDDWLEFIPPECSSTLCPRTVCPIVRRRVMKCGRVFWCGVSCR